MLGAFIWSLWAIYRKTKWEKDHFIEWLGRDGFMITILLVFGFYILFAGIGWLQPHYDSDAIDPYLDR